MRLSYRIAVLALAVAACAPAEAIAAQRVASPQQKAAVMKPIAAFVRAANAGDAKVFHGLYVTSSTIVDEFAPYEWSSAGAQDRYFADFGKTVAELKMTETNIVAGAPTYSYVDGARAYVVLPVRLTAKIAGKPYAETGSFAMTLRESGGAWKIAVQSWAKGSETFNPY